MERGATTKREKGIAHEERVQEKGICNHQAAAIQGKELCTRVRTNSRSQLYGILCRSGMGSDHQDGAWNFAVLQVLGNDAK